MGLKAHDRETMPLCWVHHRMFHDAHGPFECMTREDRRLWQEEMVERCQRIYAQVQAVISGLPEPADSSPIASP